MILRSLPIFRKPVSIMGFGTVSLGTEISERDSFALLDAFVEMGGNLIDTARVYGDFAHFIPGGSEECIGRWLAARKNRSEILLSTKGAHPDLRSMHTPRMSKAEIESDLNDSLRALGTDYIDLYWLHRDDENRPVAEIVETLADFVRQGKILHYGFSNWKGPRIEAALSYAQEAHLPLPAADQPQWSLALQENVADDTLVQMDAELYALHRKTNLVCMPYSSQARGFFLKLASGEISKEHPKGRQGFFTEANLAIFEELKRLSNQTGAGIGALALGFLTAQPFPTLPLVSASNLDQVRALGEAAELRLDAPCLQALMALTPFGQA